MRKLIFILTIILLSGMVGLAQTSTGRLIGTVSSADGVLPNAAIKVKDNKTGKELTTTAKEDGSFLFPQLEFGTYTVTITVSGFKTFVANEVKIDVGRDYNLTPTLEVGNVSETVNVTAGADVVTSTTAQVSNTISPQQIMSLPLLSRNPLSLTLQQAGTQSNAFQETMINGMRTSFTNITRDGINIQDNFIRQNATDFAPGNPSVDDTAEFTFTSSNQESDQGYGGAQIRLVTPRGTSEYHGALFVYNRNSGFAANGFFNNRSTNPTVNKKPAFRNRFQYGGKVGGPFPVFNFGEGGPMFLKNKGFFFFAYEKIKDPLSSLSTRTILTPAARTGAFSYTRTDGLNTPINSNGVTCAAAVGGTCTVTNILALANSLGFANTPSTINPVIQSRILSNIPTAGNFTGVGDQIVTTGYQFNRRVDTGRDTYTTRIDLDADEKNSFNGVYSWTRDITLRNDLDPTGYTEVPRGNLNSTSETLSLAYRRVFSPTIFNEVRGGIFFSDVSFGAFDNPSVLLAIPLINNPENNTGTQGRVVKTYNFQDNADWSMGNHSFRFGGQLQKFKPTSRDTFSILPTLSIGTSTVTPFFTCATIATCQLPGGISTAQLGTANSLLALLGGYVTQEAQTFNLVSPEIGFQGGAANIAPFSYTDHSLYFSDRWQAKSNLTVTLGLRYVLAGALKQTNDKALEVVVADPDNPTAALLDPNAVANVIGGNSGTKSAFYKTDYNNFAPQIGVAYSLKSESGLRKLILGETFVFRGGYSHIYGNDQLVTSVLQAPGNISGLASRNVLGTVNGSAQLNLRLGDGLPALTTPTLTPLPPYSFIRNSTPGVVNATQGATFFTTDPKLQTPMYKQYSFGVQREFGGSMALEIRYVGTSSNNLVRAYNVNQIDITTNGFLADFNRAAANLKNTGSPFCNPAVVANCVALQIFQNGSAATPTTVGGATPGAGKLTVGTGGLSLATFTSGLTGGIPPDLAVSFYQNGFNNHPTLTNPTAVPFVKLLPNPAAGLIALLTNDALSNYNSLQVELRRRFTQGLYFQANYTFSKTLVNSIGGDQFYFEPYLDNNNKNLDNQRADGDQTHVFNINGVYQLPFGKGKWLLNNGGIMDKIFGGWEISGLATFTTGAPINILDPRGTYNTAGRSARQTARTSLTGDQIRALRGVFEKNGSIYWIDPSVINTDGRAATAYSLTAPTTFSGQVFFVNGPGQTGDLERTVIDGPNYFNVNAALLKNVKFGENVRVQLRGEAFNITNRTNFFNNTQVANVLSTTFGQVTSAGSPRILQFGARFEF